LLLGTERTLQITREIRESNGITRNECETYPIVIKPGCKEEHIICLKEVGDRDPINTPADLFITIRSRPHPLYKRQGADLIYTKTISYADVSLKASNY
jgi:DnaJ family protein B protein 4